MSLACRILLLTVSFLIGGREISSSILTQFDFEKQLSSLAGESDDAASWILDNETSGSGEEEDFDESSIEDAIDTDCSQQNQLSSNVVVGINRTVDLSLPDLSVLFRNLRL
jgi:hypothetical protein